MKVELRNNMDVIAGVMLLLIGGSAFYTALEYPFGSSLRMGPGYFPRVLAGIIMTFGLYVLVRGLRTGEKVKGRWGFKPLAIIVLSLIAFGWTMEHYGFFPALAVLFLIAPAASPEWNWKEVPILFLLMSAFAYLVFIRLIGLPYPLFGAY